MSELRWYKQLAVEAMFSNGHARKHAIWSTLNKISSALDDFRLRIDQSMLKILIQLLSIVYGFIEGMKPLQTAESGFDPCRGWHDRRCQQLLACCRLLSFHDSSFYS
jgi:hypothetical protein